MFVKLQWCDDFKNQCWLITIFAAKGKVDDLESNIVKQGQYAKAAALQLDVGGRLPQLSCW